MPLVASVAMISFWRTTRFFKSTSCCTSFAVRSFLSSTLTGLLALIGLVGFAATFFAGAFFATAFLVGAFFATAFFATAFLVTVLPFALFLSALNTATIVLLVFLRTARSNTYIVPATCKACRIASPIASASTRNPSWPKSELMTIGASAVGTSSDIST